MKKIIYAILLIFAVSCCPNPKAEQLKTVLLKAEVAGMTPDSVIAILKSGNANFVQRQTTSRDIKSQLKESATLGQAPMAIVLSCIDSRVPVEYIFDMGLGDIFVSRVAGNVVSRDVLGSMEYACAHAGSKVALVLGHTSCGAVHSACEGVSGGNLTDMLAKIKPAIETVGKSDSDHHSHEFQDKVVFENVRNMMEQIRVQSPVLKALEDKGEISIVGAVFDLHSGEVKFL